MRVSLSWLEEFVDVTLPVPELCERLDMTGTKVEAVHTLGAAIEGVVVGRVLSKEPHPDAEKLTYCSVDVGKNEPLKIVCGATNFAAGDHVAVACAGATLPDGTTIKKAKIRGLESHGMMCSAIELGVGSDAAGLLILPDDAPVGAPFAQYYGLADTVLELEVTPNRPDCLSMVGVSREVAAVTGRRAVAPETIPVEEGTPAADLVSVEINDAALCPRYTARVIRNVKVGPSPAWLADRITAAGARPINNVVDVTNFVMYELGQPLHAFDLATLATRDGKAAIIVRTAAPGETLRTLDGQDRALAEDTLLITDPSGPVALAGVMGGEDTEVSDATIDVLLEAACFDTSSISRTSRRLGLISEASLRFERGVDPNLAARASDRAAALIAETSGGTVAPGIVDVYPAPRGPLGLRLRTGRANAVLGTSLTGVEIAELLARLELDVDNAQDSDVLDVRVPTFRPDLEREIDLIEEVARLWGLENIESTRPGGRERVGGRTAEQVFRARIGETMRAAGLDEHIGYAFADRADLSRLGWELGPEELLVDLINPMSEEQGVLRWTLASSLLRAVSNNTRRGVLDAHLYELGTVFFTAPGRKLPKERLALGGVLAGRWQRPGWSDTAPMLDFFDGKGVLETLMTAVRVQRWSVREGERPWLQRGRSAEIVVGGDVVGWLGEVAPAVLDAFETPGPVTLFELLVPALVKAGGKTAIVYRDLPRFPAVTLDVAVVVAEQTPVAQIEAAMRSAGGALLESVHLFDVYRDPPDADPAQRRLPVGKKSVAFSLTYRAQDRTLTDEDVRRVHEALLRRSCAAVGAELRA